MDRSYNNKSAEVKLQEQAVIEVDPPVRIDHRGARFQAQGSTPEPVVIEVDAPNQLCNRAARARQRQAQLSNLRHTVNHMVHRHMNAYYRGKSPNHSIPERADTSSDEEGESFDHNNGLDASGTLFV